MLLEQEKGAADKPRRAGYRPICSVQKTWGPGLCWEQTQRGLRGKGPSHGPRLRGSGGFLATCGILGQGFWCPSPGNSFGDWVCCHRPHVHPLFPAHDPGEAHTLASRGLRPGSSFSLEGKRNSPDHQAPHPGAPKTREGMPDPVEGWGCQLPVAQVGAAASRLGHEKVVAARWAGQVSLSCPPEGPAPKVGRATPSHSCLGVPCDHQSEDTMCSRVLHAQCLSCHSHSVHHPAVPTPPLLLVTSAALAPCLVRATGTTPPSHLSPRPLVTVRRAGSEDL